MLLLFFIQRKVVGVLEGLRGLPACVLLSPAPSSAARAKGLSFWLSGRPDRGPPGQLPPPDVLGAGRALLLRTNWPTELSKAEWMQLPQPFGLPLSEASRPPWLCR